MFPSAPPGHPPGHRGGTQTPGTLRIRRKGPGPGGTVTGAMGPAWACARANTGKPRHAACGFVRPPSPSLQAQALHSLLGRPLTVPELPLVPHIVADVEVVAHGGPVPRGPLLAPARSALLLTLSLGFLLLCSAGDFLAVWDTSDAYGVHMGLCTQGPLSSVLLPHSRVTARACTGGLIVPRAPALHPCAHWSPCRSSRCP